MAWVTHGTQAQTRDAAYKRSVRDDSERPAAALWHIYGQFIVDVVQVHSAVKVQHKLQHVARQRHD